MWFGRRAWFGQGRVALGILSSSQGCGTHNRSRGLPNPMHLCGGCGVPHQTPPGLPVHSLCISQVPGGREAPRRGGEACGEWSRRWPQGAGSVNARGWAPEGAVEKETSGSPNRSRLNRSTSQMRQLSLRPAPLSPPVGEGAQLRPSLLVGPCGLGPFMLRHPPVWNGGCRVGEEAGGRECLPYPGWRSWFAFSCPLPSPPDHQTGHMLPPPSASWFQKWVPPCLSFPMLPSLHHPSGIWAPDSPAR